jgi:hypothetical protein
MLRSNPHAALYSQLASPYPPHLYGLLPGSPANLPAIHERMKLEEEHRARIAREEEKAREEREREMREREQREKEMREREQREKEQREREKREKEMREREMREKEMREREMREKEQREREMREKEIQREREKMIQQHHFMQSQRNPYGLLGLFPPMVGLRPSQMHPAYGSMHPSLLGLPPLATTLASSIPIPPHHSQSPQNIPPNVVPTSSPGLSVMSPLGLTSSPHGLPHSLPLFPPPAHLYSPLAPPTASPSSLSNSSYSHPMLTNPVSSPQPTRPPSNNPTPTGITSREQSLNLSKNSINMSSTTPPLSQQQQQFSRRNEVDTKPLHSASIITTTTTSSTASSVSINNLNNEQKPKPTDLTQQQQQQNGNNAGISLKVEEQTIKDEKSPPAESLKASVLMEKPLIEMNIKVEGDEKKEEKVKVESSPTSPKSIMEMSVDVKKDVDNSVINSKTGESESIVTPMEVDEKKSDEKMMNDDATTIAEKEVLGTNINNNETNKTSSKKA